MITTYIQWITRHRVAVVAAMLLVTTAIGSQARNLKVIIDPAATFPQDNTLIAVSNRVESIFGNRNLVVVGIMPRTGDVFQVRILEKVKRITDAVGNLPGAVHNRVLSISSRSVKDIRGTDRELFVKPLLPETLSMPGAMATLRDTLRRNPFYSGVLVSKDQTALFVLADFKKDPDGYQSIVNRVNEAVRAERDDQTDIVVGGQPVFLGLIERFAARMGFLFPIAILIIGLIHYEAFRTGQALVLPLVTALLAVAWSMGIMGALGVPLDVFNTSTPILILAIAAGHAVQILKRYYEDYDRLRDRNPEMDPSECNRQAVVESVRGVAPVMIAAGMIAALSFLSLCVFQIKVIRVFGIFTALGILSTLILELTFIPALRSVLQPPSDRERKREKQNRLWDRMAQGFAEICLFRRAWVYVAAALTLGVCILGAAIVTTDSSTKGNFYGDLPELQADNRLNEKLGGTNVIYGLIEGDRDDAIKDPRVLQAMEKIQRYLESQPQVGKTLSIADFIRRINFSMHGDRTEFDRIPDDARLIGQYLFLYSSSGDPSDFDRYVDYGYRNASILALLKTDAVSYVDELIGKLDRFARSVFDGRIRFSIGGSAAEAAALNDTIIREKLLNIGQIGLAVFLIASLLFRSLVAGLLVLVPLVITVLANFGIMGLLQIPLEIATSLTSAMAVGIGADYAIYLSYRFREELNRDSDEPEAIRRAFASAGKAVLFVSSAVAGGYSVMMLSFGFLPHIRLGLLISISMLVSSISSLTIFPSLILTLRPSFIFERKPSR